MITVIDLSSDDETPTPIQNGMSVISPTPTTQEQRNQRLGQHCQISPPKSKRLKNDDHNCNKVMDANDLEFIDHVVMTWLNRVRSGYRNLEMPDNILKAKAKEAANLLNLQNQFSATNSWLKGFQEKIKIVQQLKQNTNDTGNNQVFRIEEIIKEEKPKFLKNKSNEKLNSQLKEIEDNQQNRLAKMLEEQKKHLENVKEKQRQQMEQIKHAQKQRSDYLRKQEEEMKKKIIEHRKLEQITIPVPPPPVSATKLRFGVLRKPGALQIAEVRGAVPNKPPPEPETVTLLEVIDVDDVLDEPIQSYEEALDCLALVENYFLSTRNLKAVMFVNQIETFLKKQLES